MPLLFISLKEINEIAMTEHKKTLGYVDKPKSISRVKSQNDQEIN